MDLTEEQQKFVKETVEELATFGSIAVQVIEEIQKGMLDEYKKQLELLKDESNELSKELVEKEREFTKYKLAQVSKIDSKQDEIDALKAFIDSLSSGESPVPDDPDPVPDPEPSPDGYVKIPWIIDAPKSTDSRWAKLFSPNNNNHITVENNMWNIAGIPNPYGKIETLVDRKFRFEAESDDPLHPFDVDYYQQVYIGAKLWDKTSNSTFFPAPISKYQSIIIDQEWSMVKKPNTHNNVAFEVFLIDKPFPENAKHKKKEIMIWLDSTWEQPSIVYRDIEIEDEKWNVTVSGEYVAFQPIGKPLNKYRFDLIPFIKFLEGKGEVSSDWVIPALEHGFELVNGDVDEFKLEKFEVYVKE